MIAPSLDCAISERLRRCDGRTGRPTSGALARRWSVVLYLEQVLSTAAHSSTLYHSDEPDGMVKWLPRSTRLVSEPSRPRRPDSASSQRRLSSSPRTDSRERLWRVWQRR